jgi:hypothetical protein
MADPSQRRGVLRADVEAWLDELCPRDEESDGLEARELSERRELLGIGGGQRGDTPGKLSGHPEELAAGGEDSEVSGGLEEGVDEVGAGLDEVLAVVEDE